MKYWLIIFTFFSLHSFAQDPEHYIEVESFNEPQSKWDFKIKPYKNVKTLNNKKLQFESDYDKEGNVIKTQFYSGDYIYVHEYNFRGKLKTFYKDYKLSRLPEFPIEKKTESQIFKVKFDANGKIINGESGRISVNDEYRKIGTSYYDSKERIVKFVDENGKSTSSFTYKKNNLASKVSSYKYENKEDKVIKNFKYKNNLPVYFETIKEKYFDGKLVNKEISSSVIIEYKNKLPIKKVFKNKETSEERTFKYDKNNNLLHYSIKMFSNQDKSLRYEKWYKYEYENNLKISSYAYDGSSTHPDGKENRATFEYENGLLKRIVGTFNIEKNRKIVEEYFYNSYNHLIRKEHRILDQKDSGVEEYQIEYF